MRRGTFGIIVAAAVAATALGGSVEHKPTGITLTLPAGWYTADEGKEQMVVSGPGEEVEVTLRKTDVTEGAALASGIEKELDGLLSKVVVKQGPTKEVVGGLAQFRLSGTGVQDGTELRWSLYLVPNGGKSLIVLAVGEVEKHAKDVQAIAASVRK